MLTSGGRALFEKRIVVILLSMLLLSSSILVVATSTYGDGKNRDAIFSSRADSSYHMLERDDTIVQIVPHEQTVLPGQTFSIDIDVIPGQPMRVVELKLSFDPSLVRPLCVTEGDLFHGFYTWFNGGTIDNDTGTIVDIYDLIVGVGNVSDSGTFVTIDFSAQENIGTSPLHMYDVEVFNETHSVPITVIDGSVTVSSGENLPPNTPQQPAGPTFGHFDELCNYTASTTDPNEDLLWYWFDWGDTTHSGWLGPYTSGQTVECCHTWSQRGNYEVRVKAKDIHDDESAFSEPLVVHIAAPVLSVQQIRSGMAMVGADIKNVGDADASDVEWTISVRGGLIGIIDVQTQGTMLSLAVEQKTRVNTDFPILGFGLIDITVTAETDGSPQVQESAKAFILLYFIIILP